MQRILLVMCCGLTVAAHAEIYKWVDAQGHIQYSDQPHGGGKDKTVEIKDTHGLNGGPRAGRAHYSGSGNGGSRGRQSAEYCANLRSEMMSVKSSIQLITDGQGKKWYDPNSAAGKELASLKMEYAISCQ